MRISDWSSDVCSSDLQMSRKKRWGWDNGKSAGWNRSASLVVNHDCCWLGHFPRCIGSSRQSYDDLGLGRSRNWHRRDGKSDRKSVVSGKSVSVRVVLGGRGIIKKNNIRDITSI